jgi:CRP-like cAMP-binding protein
MCIESFFLQEPSRLVIETLEPSKIYAIPYNKLQELTRTSYEFCQLMFSFLEHSLILSQRKADTLRFESAKERYLRTLNDHPDLVRRAPLHYLASYLQMTPETLSRVRKGNK